MRDTLVSARMPQAKKERAQGVLESIGATASDLINSAYDYVITTKQLPFTSQHAQRTREDLARFVAETSFEVVLPSGSAESGYKDLAIEMRIADYESLA